MRPEAVTPDEATRVLALGTSGLDALRRPFGVAASDSEGLYDALFGRDSLWTLLLLLAAMEERPEEAALRARVEEIGTRLLPTLAGSQGRVVSDHVEEQPGKIIHEFRERLDERLIRYGMPFEAGRSYSGFDQTFLFVIAVDEFAAAFPDSGLPRELWPAVVAAIAWVETFADEDGDGFLEYRRRDPRNQLNQVWKDSFDSITHTGFDAPPAPVAWVEVQGYAVRALLAAARLADRLSANDDASRRWRDRARALGRAIDNGFWMEKDDYYAVAIDGTKRQVRQVTSNAGHLLWAGAVTEERTARLVARMSRPDLTTRYGLRCLSSTDPNYAPHAYHRGSVWPFDTAVVAAGLLRYGHKQQGLALLEGIVRALVALGTPTETYVVLNTDDLVSATSQGGELLAYSNAQARSNRIQAFSCAAAIYASSVLTAMNRRSDAGRLGG